MIHRDYGYATINDTQARELAIQLGLAEASWHNQNNIVHVL